MKAAKLTENHSTHKQFNYTKGEVSLSFSLKINNKGQMEDFKEILTKALSDLKIELDK